MEIRPYRSQVRSTPTLEYVDNRVPTAKAQAYQAYGDMISKTGQSVSQQFYGWNEAMQKRQAQDRKIAYQAGVQEIDLLFAELGKTMNDNMAKMEQDPFSAFDADTKNALNETYVYNVNQIKDNTVGRAADPDTKYLLELYFRQKKLEAGAVVEGAIKTHTDKIAASVMGKANAGLVEAAVAGDEKDIDNSLNGIRNNLNILLDRGVISTVQAGDDLAAAKKQIYFGRAKKQVDALDYKTGQEFINQVDIDDENRKKLQTYFDDKWKRQKNIWEKEQGEAVAEHTEAIINGTESVESILGDARLKPHPEVDMNTNFEKQFFDALDKGKDKEQRKRGYNLRINDGDYTVRYDIINDPDLTAAEQEHFLDDINTKKKEKGDKEYEDTLDGYYQRIENGENPMAEVNKSDLKPKDKAWLRSQYEAKQNGGSGKSGGKSDTPMSARGAVSFKNLFKVITNPELVDNSRLLMLAQWAADNPDDAAHPDVLELNNNIKQHKLVTDPRMVELDDRAVEKINDLNKAGKTDKAAAIETARRSVLHTLAVDCWYTQDDQGNKTPVPEIKRKEMIKTAIDNFEKILAMSDLTDPFNYQYTEDPPVIEDNGKDYGYTIKFREGGAYDRVKKNIFAAHILQDLDAVSKDMNGMEQSERLAFKNMDIDLTGYKYTFQYIRGKGGNMYFYNPDKDDAYFIDYNKKGRLNGYHLTYPVVDGEVVPTIEPVTPPTVKRIVDTKAAAKTAEKEKIKEWAREIDEMADIDKVVQ